MSKRRDVPVYVTRAGIINEVNQSRQESWTYVLFKLYRTIHV